jgi:UDP-galactopyranose mutase
MSGSVLKTVNEKGVELARSQEMLSNGKPIQDSVTQAHELISERFNQPGALHFSAISNISTVAYEEIIKLSTEQIWGEAKTDVELRNALERLEERLNHM